MTLTEIFELIIRLVTPSGRENAALSLRTRNNDFRFEKFSYIINHHSLTKRSDFTNSFKIKRIVSNRYSTFKIFY